MKIWHISDTKINELVDEILNELNGRKGFDGWYSNLDNEIKEEIEYVIFEIIENKLDKDK